jgi:hypothetical protein
MKRVKKKKQRKAPSNILIRVRKEFSPLRPDAHDEHSESHLMDQYCSVKRVILCKRWSGFYRLNELNWPK